MATYGGVDLGATNVRAVVGDGRGNVLATAGRETPRGPDGSAVTDAVIGCLRRACEGASIAPERLEAVGVGSIGPLDPDAGGVRRTANLPDSVELVPLCDPLSELIGGGPVTLHNDAAAGVIGERFYSDDAPGDMVYLTVSSGIGAGVCMDGRVVDGWRGNAGEVGHTVVDPDGFMTCGCGVPGHWEAYCSGDNIPGYASRLHREHGTDTALPVCDSGFEAADIFAYAGEDRLADRVLDRLVEWNTIGIANLVCAYAPRVVSVGGAVALENPEWIVDPVRERLGDRVLPDVPDLRLTDLGEDAVVLGGLASAITGRTGHGPRPSG